MAKMIKGKQLGLLSIATASKLAPTLAWGGSGSNSDTSMFYENARSNWMNDVGSVSIKVEGCVWATTDDNEDVGCMEDESGDGTTYWYQMAMCRRAQVAYSVYTSSSSSTSCNNGSYRGTYVTQDGLSEFAYIMGSYGGAISENDIGDLPMCEQGNNGYYMSVGCASDGSFTIDTFSDGYCLEREGTYDNLSSVNSIIKSNFKSCYNVYSSDSGSTWDYSAAGALIDASKPCTSLDSPLCTSTSRVEEASSGKISTLSSAGHSIKNFNVANKAKYALGTLCLIGSLFMFLGILFTNRRKRRAMMQRKMRASKRERARRSSSKGRSSSRHKSSASRSRSRGAGASSRSRSRARSASKRADDDEGGVFA